MNIKQKIELFIKEQKGKAFRAESIKSRFKNVNSASIDAYLSQMTLNGSLVRVCRSVYKENVKQAKKEIESKELISVDADYNSIDTLIRTIFISVCVNVFLVATIVVIVGAK